MNPIVSQIRIYPVKSLDPVKLDEVIIGKRCLLHDREFALFNSEGKYVNGKRTPRINELRSVFDLSNYEVTFSEENGSSSQTFNLIEEKTEIEEYLSGFFGYSVSIHRSDNGKFLDIPDLSGITVCSEESLKSLLKFFPEITLEEMRLRFRASIEISNVEAFWEDRLFGKPDTVVEFEINDVKLLGISPRARCIVPTRDAATGQPYPHFTKKFVEARKSILPEWSLLSEYEHYYYLSVDTLIPDSETGKKIKIGDEIKIKGKKEMSVLNV